MEFGMVKYLKIVLLTLLAGYALADGPVVLKCQPQVLRGIPGAPLRAELTVETPDAQPVRVLIPSVSNLFLRTVEKVPIQRTADGQFVQKRIVIWQGTEAGSVTITNLSADFGGTANLFPVLEITIDAVPVAPLPAALPLPPPAKGEGD